MKTIITILLALICSLTTFAQYKHFNEETKQWKEYSSYEGYIFEKSEFIFEGTVIKNKGYWSEKDQMVYTSNIVQIDKIFRGGNILKLGTIEIVTRGGVLRDEQGNMIKGYEIPSSMPYQSGSKGVFFCVPSNYSLSNFDADNKIRVKTLTLAGFAFDGVRVFNKNYKTKDELYDYLSKQKNIIIPKEEILPIKKKDASGSLDVENKKKYVLSQSNYEKYMQYVQAKIASNATNKANGCKEFFISEYADGPQKNKVIEIYNPSDSIKSLNGYSIKIFNNGAPTPLDIPLSGNVNPKETYVVTHPQADPQLLTKANQTSVKMNFDGNDAIVLNKGTSTYIDKIGEIGVNPGQGGWNIPPGASTKQQDLRRKQPIDKGETDWNQGKNQWDAFPQDSLENVKQHQNICSSILLVNDVSFSFANPTESGTNPKYFEFDVMVEANNNSTYLDNALFHIKYNSAAFGNNAVANNKVTVTKGTSFNTATYIDPNLYMNNGVDTIFIPFGSDPGQTSWNRTLITSSAVQLMHIKIEIQNCGQFSDLNFTNTSFTSGFSWFTTTATDDPINSVPYDNTNYGIGLNQELCPPPVINTFTSPVYPGTYYDGTTETKHVLTIQGSGFGAPRGNGNVYFKNANTGGQNNTFLNGNDIKDWTDSKIIITVPSIVDTSIFAANETRVPGSGIFFIVTNSGDTVYSNSPIDMPYAIKNVIDPLSTNGKLRMDLTNKTDTVGYEFYLGPSITNHPNPMVETIVRRAVKDWACNTLVNFVVKGNTSVDASLPDGVSVIHLVNSFPNTSTLAETTIGNDVCGDLASVKHTFPTEIDIAFLADPATVGQGSWLYDTSSAVLPAGYRDFYEVAVHEVGHGDLLSHVNNVNDVMFYSGLYDINNNISGGNRRWIAVNDADGGENVVERSKTIVYNGSCSFETSTYISGGFSCAGVTSVKEQLIILDDFNLFPNPSYNGFTVDYTLKRNASVQFVFLDYTGRELKRFDQKNEPTGRHNLYIETSNLTAGLYFLVANINGKLQTMKVIKQ